MRIFVHKKPLKVTILGVVMIVFSVGTTLLVFQGMSDDEGLKAVMIAALVTMFIILFLKSVFAPLLSGVTLEDGQIQDITMVGGVVTVNVDEIDHGKSCLGPRGLLIVSLSGESIGVSTAEYSWDSILQVAEYAKITDGSWTRA